MIKKVIYITDMRFTTLRYVGMFDTNQECINWFNHHYFGDYDIGYEMLDVEIVNDD
jgi:hypothetical protein